MINYIVYGNSDYLDVLTIQTDHMIGRGHLTLFIDKNDLDLTDLYSKYNKVIFYNGADTYAQRLLTCLESVEHDYFLLIHDIDILIDVDNLMVEQFFTFLSEYDYDRVDLKFTPTINPHSLLTEADKFININDWKDIFKEEIEPDTMYLVKQTDPKGFIYNVNPSIWKKESLVKLLGNFKHKTYRNIEDMDVQNFSTQFNVFKLFTTKVLECGFYRCVEGFKFLHISHSGKLLPLNDSFTTPYGQPYNDVAKEYVAIVDKYNLRQSSKWM